MNGSATRCAARRFLRIYLQDHRAGAHAGVAIAKRLRDSNRGTPLGNDMVEIVDEIVDDGAFLAQVMAELDVRTDPVKVIGTRAAAALGRLKPNARLRRYSPLSRVLELEGLASGVLAKRALWTSLREAGVQLAAGAGELDRRSERATNQIRRISEHHRRAASEAFSGSKN